MALSECFNADYFCGLGCSIVRPYSLRGVDYHTLYIDEARRDVLAALARLNAGIEI